jgi:hypothetical protein
MSAPAREPDRLMRWIGRAIAYAIAIALAAVVIACLAAGAWWVIRAVWSL